MEKNKTMPAREFLKIVNVPNWMLRENLLALIPIARQAISQQNRVIWGALFAIFLAVLLPIFDLNTSQTMSRQLISPFAAFVISIWVFFQINYPIEAVVHLDLVDEQDIQMLRIFHGLEYQIQRLGDREFAHEACLKILHSLALGVKRLESAVEEAKERVKEQQTAEGVQMAVAHQQVCENELAEAEEIFDSHFSTWRNLGFHYEKRKFFFGQNINKSEPVHGKSSTGFPH